EFYLFESAAAHRALWTPRGPGRLRVLMDTQDVICAITVLFIVGMVWLRTRMQYARQAQGPLRLQRAGKLYFAVLAAVLLLGWLVAPIVGREMWPDANVTSGLMRVVWFLATYYVFILVHRVMRSSGLEVFKAPPQ
ncbi:MAG TPA: hypothetical protein VHB68_07280, partial [Steroidobacteraceae bacterium]|nr:hypothetical protein [Steroidobacteraceae bacterium]